MGVSLEKPVEQLAWGCMPLPEGRGNKASKGIVPSPATSFAQVLQLRGGVRGFVEGDNLGREKGMKEDFGLLAHDVMKSGLLRLGQASILFGKGDIEATGPSAIGDLVAHLAMGCSSKEHPLVARRGSVRGTWHSQSDEEEVEEPLGLLKGDEAGAMESVREEERDDEDFGTVGKNSPMEIGDSMVSCCSSTIDEAFLAEVTKVL